MMVVVVVGLTIAIKGLAVQLTNIVVVRGDTIYEVVYTVCGSSHMFAKSKGVVMVHLVELICSFHNPSQIIRLSGVMVVNGIPSLVVMGRLKVSDHLVNYFPSNSSVAFHVSMNTGINVRHNNYRNLLTTGTRLVYLAKKSGTLLTVDVGSIHDYITTLAKVMFDILMHDAEYLGGVALY
jgi:hypothetical protein